MSTDEERTPAASSDPPEHVDSMMSTLYRIQQLMDRGYREHRNTRQLNDKDMAALEYLSQEWKAERAVSPRNVAAYLGLTSATTTAVLDRLEAEGYLHRRRTDADRRVVYLTPAPAMAEWLEQHPAQFLRTSFAEAAALLGREEARIIEHYFATVLDNARRHFV